MQRQQQEAGMQQEQRQLQGYEMHQPQQKGLQESL
jgi:hypothetical protein